MLAAEKIFTIRFHPEDAPNCVFMSNTIGLGLDHADPDAGEPVGASFSFYVETDEEEPGRWSASIGIDGAGPPRGEGATELAAVVDLRRQLLEVLRGDLADFIATWADDLAKLALEAEESDLANENDGYTGRCEMLDGHVFRLRWIAQIMRAKAKLRELDGPTITVTVGGSPIAVETPISQWPTVKSEVPR